jgi:hypothetical protein
MDREKWQQEQAKLQQLALQTWGGFDHNERGFVRFGFFPQEKIDPAMRRAEELGLEQRELASALMELAARNASERY